MAGIIWQVVRENDNGTDDTVVEEWNSKAVAERRVEYFQSLGECYYYLDSR